MYSALRATQQPGDKAVLALVGRRRRAFAAHHAIDGFDGHLAREGRRIGLPARDLALARLPRRRGDVKRLLHRLIDRLGRQSEQRADAGGGGRTEMGDVIDLVLVQANALHEIDLDFVGGGQPANEVRARQSAMLGDREHGGNVVAGMRIVRRQERVVEIELAHGNAIGPGRPFRRNALCPVQPEHRSPRPERMRLGLRAGARDRAPRDRGRGNRGIVDHAIADHIRHVDLDGDGVGGDVGDLPGQLIGAGKLIGGFERANAVLLQDAASSLI